MSLAKYLWIVAGGNDRALDIRNVGEFLSHALSRVDWRRDLHFQTCTTIDTLDYSGSALNEGSKVVIAAAGPAIRSLPNSLPRDFKLPPHPGGPSAAGEFHHPRVALAGVLVLEGPRYRAAADGSPDTAVERFCAAIDVNDPLNQFPLWVIVDDSEFAASSLRNFLWTTFTRSNPAADVFGVGSFVDHKHWGCRGALVIDARMKPHHAPPLVEDPAVSRRVDALAAPGGPLHGVI